MSSCIYIYIYIDGIPVGATFNRVLKVIRDYNSFASICFSISLLLIGSCN